MELVSNKIFEIFFIIAAYMLGSISSAILLCKIFKLPDPRSCGSKNPGTTNVLRVANKYIAALVLLCDVSKGFFAVYLAKCFGASDWVAALVAIAVFMGHLFPIFFNFTGGKGVATTLGIILALCWQLGLLTLIIWITVFILFRVSSLAALITTLSIMLLAGVSLYLKLYNWLQPGSGKCIIFLGILIIIKHKTNIGNLINNKESKI